MKALHSILSRLGLAAAVIALTGLAACGNEDNIAEEAPTRARTYYVSIEACLADDAATTRAVTDIDGTTITSKFVTGEKVYVYDCDDSNWLDYLEPSDISADGKGCKLTGTLSESDMGGMPGGDMTGHRLKLFYNPNYVISMGNMIEYYYTAGHFDEEYNQDGTIVHLVDSAIADDEDLLVAEGATFSSLTTTKKASFRLVQSQFRFSLHDPDNNNISMQGRSIRVHLLLDLYAC